MNRRLNSASSLPMALGIAVGLILTLSDAANAVKAGPEVRDALRSMERVRVIVALRMPESVALSADSLRRVVDATRSRTLAGIPTADFEPSLRFETLPAVGGLVTSAGLAELESRSDVLAVSLDGAIHANLIDTVPQIQADDLRSRHQITGNGVTVAVLDTGIDRDHPDLSGALVGERCFCPSGFLTPVCCPNGSGSQSGTGSAEDDNGHGTAVSGVITSDGVVAASGVAPNAKIHAIKVLGSSGSGSFGGLLQAFDYLVASAPSVKVINLSLGDDDLHPGECDDEDATSRTLATAVAALAARGTVTIAGSGNESFVGGMSFPACLRGVVAVGAVSKSDGILSFSNVSEGLDILAPGGAVKVPWVGGGTLTADGTSLAAPHVAAVAAGLLQASPSITVPRLARVLSATGRPLLDSRVGSKFPRLDAHEAYDHQVYCGNGQSDVEFRILAGILVPNYLEECDDGNSRDGDGCTSDCRRCGNGTISWPERCDDGNLVSGDGCDANCQPSGCGNGFVAGNEECDDGNRIPFDGCSAGCEIEPFPHLCYQARRVDGGKFTALSTSVVDAFGSDEFVMKSGELVCLPASVGGRLPAAVGESTLLRRYKGKAGYFAPLAGPGQRPVAGDDELTLDLTVQAATHLAVPSAGSFVSPPSPVSSFRIPSYACHRSKETDRTKPRKFSVDVRDALGTLSLDVEGPQSLCVPANRGGTGPGDQSEATRLACYKARVTRNTPPFEPNKAVFSRSSLEAESLIVSRPAELCLPAIAE